MATPFTYGDVSRSFDNFGRAQGFDSMPEYVRYLADSNPEAASVFGAGADQSFLKDANVFLNSAIDKTGLPDLGELAGGAAGGALFGAPEAGARAGRQAARGTLNLVPLFLTGGGTLPAQLAGAVGAGGLTGVDVYEQTGDPVSAVTTGALTTALPWLAKAGSQAALAAVGAPKVGGIATQLTEKLLPGTAAGSVVSQRVADTLGQRVASYVGGQTAALVPFGAKDYVEAKARGVENPLGTKDYWVETVIGQLPFAASDVASVVRKGPSSKLTQATLLKEPPQTVPKVTPTQPNPPPKPNPVVDAQTNIVLDTMKKKAQVVQSGLEGEARKAALDALDKQQNEALLKLNKTPDVDRAKTQLGAPVVAEGIVTVRGTVRGETQPDPTREGHGGSYFVSVEGADSLGLVGRVVGIPKKLVKVNEDGSFSIPRKYLFMAGDRMVQDGPKTPELPVSPRPLTGRIEPVPARREVELDAFGNPDWNVDPDGAVQLAVRAFDDNPDVGVEGDVTTEQLNATRVQALQTALQQKRAADEAKLNATVKLAETLPKEEPQTLEEAKAQLTVIDKVNETLGNGKKTASDDELRKELEQELTRAKSELTTAAKVVVAKKKSEAADKIDTAQKITKRKQKQIERQVRGAVVFGEVAAKAKGVNKALTEHADAVTDAKKQGKPVPAEPTVDVAAQRDAAEVALLEDIMSQYDASMEGRMLEFVDELKVAYADWRENAEVQQSLTERAKGNEDKLTTLRKASLLELAKTVRLRHSVGKVITGGKVLRKGGKWSGAGEKAPRHTFATKAEAEAYLDSLIESDKIGDVDARSVKAMSYKDRKGVETFYLQERPRNITVEFTPGEVTSDKPVLTQAEIDADVSSDAFEQLEVERRVGMASKAKETVETLRELGTSGTMVTDTVRDITLGLTHEDVIDAYRESGEVFTPDDIDKAAMRLAVLNDGIAGVEVEGRKGTLPAPKDTWSEQALAEYQARLLSKGAGFDTLDQIRDFLTSPALRLLQLEVGNRLRNGFGEHSVYMTDRDGQSFEVEGWELPRWLNYLNIDQEAVQKNILDHKLDARTPVDALKLYASEGDILANALLEYSDILSDTHLAIIDQQRGANFNQGDRTIRIGMGFLDGRFDRDYIKNLLIHEASHAVSARLVTMYPNHPAVKQLDQLRKLYIAAQSPRMQKLIEGGQKKIEEFSRGKSADWGTTDKEELGIMYAGVNLHEFIAQSFSDTRVREILSNIKTKENRSLFQWFAHWMSKLVGKTPDTSNALEQVLLQSRRIFDANRSFLNFERLMRNQLSRVGLLDREALQRRMFNFWSLAQLPIRNEGDYHFRLKDQFMGDLMLGSLGAGEHAMITNSFDVFNYMPPHEQAKLKQLLTELDGKTVEDPMGSAIELVFKGIEDQALLEKLLDHSPALMARLTESVIQHGYNTLNILHEQELFAGHGLINLRPRGDIPTLRNVMRKYENAMNIVGNTQEANKIIAEMDNAFGRGPMPGFPSFRPDIDQIDMGSLDQVQPAGPDRMYPKPVDEALAMDDTRKTMGAFWKTVAPAWQVAMQYPAIKPVVALAFNFKGEVGRALHRVFAHFATKVSPDGVVDWNKDTMDRAKKFFGRPDLMSRADKILLLRNAKKGFLTSTDPIDKRGLNDALSGLSPDDRNLVMEMADHQSRSMQELQEIIVDEERNMGTLGLANILHHGTTQDVEVSRRQAQDMLHAFTQMRDPAQMQVGVQALQALRATIEPEKFLRAIQFAEQEVTRVAEFERFFGERQWFATEQRFDKWKVRARLTDGRAFFVDGPTREAALKKLQETDASATVIDVIQPEKNGAQDRLYGVPQKFLSKIEELEQVQFNSLRAAGFDEARIEALQNNSLVASLKKELAANQLYKPGSKRLGVAGREYLPMLANHFNYGTAVVNSLMKRKTRAEALYRVQNPDLQQAPDQAGLALEHIENFLAPDSEWAQKASHGIATYNLAFNLANHAAEAVQALTTHTTQLTAEGAGVIGGYQRVLSATKDIIKWAKKGGKWGNPEHEKLMQLATLDKEIGFGVWDDSLADSDAVLQEFRDLIGGKEDQGVKGIVKSAVHGYSKLGANLYGVFTHFNARVALLSSFDYYRSKGMDFDTAYQKAREFNRTVNFSGGRAARPVGLYKTRGEWRSASQFLGLMRSYMLGMWATLARNMKTGYGKSSNLPYAERVASRKATVQMLFTMFAMGGALGLPGAEAAIAATEQFTDLKLKESLRSFITSALGDPTLSEGFLMGVPNMMGVDAHSRVSLGGFPGVSSFSGVSLTDLLGPAYGLVERLAVGAKKAVSGGPQEFSYALPPGFRRLAELAKGGGEVLGPRGDLVSGTTFGEKFALAVGFDPTRIAHLKESERVRRRSQLIDREESNAFNVKVAERIRVGDVHGAKAAVVERASVKKDQDLRTIVRGVQDAVERRTFPAELLDKPGNSAALAAAYGMQNIPNEVARMQLRDHVARLLGLPVAASGRQVQKASLVDSILSRSPELSRRQARNLAEDF